jgi:plastocyanin
MRVLAAVLAVAAAALPLACGDDDDDRGRTVTVPAEPPRPIEIVGDEYFFDPSTVVVTGAGDEASFEVEFVLDNQGSLAHNVRVFLDDEELGGTPTFGGGEKRSGKVPVGPGEYRLVCTVADHEEQGMTGKLVVR